MKGQLKAIWNVLRGKPTLYGATFFGTVTLDKDLSAFVDDCQFRGDDEGRGGLKFR